MKRKILIRAAISLVLLMLSSQQAHAKNSSSLSNRLDNMGGNKELMRKAKAVDSQNRFRIVQKREVDRDMRLELGLSYGFNAGGDSYVNTQNIGASADFHFTPKFSVGVRYYHHNNVLTSEGQRVVDDFEKSKTDETVAVDYPLDSTLAVFSYYPLYGKMNWFDKVTTQFDVYMLAGAGQMNLQSGPTSSWTAGGGVGMWLSQNVSSRLEVRYQGYQDEVYAGSRDQGMVVSTFSLGILL